MASTSCVRPCNTGARAGKRDREGNGLNPTPSIHTSYSELSPSSPWGRCGPFPVSQFPSLSAGFFFSFFFAKFLPTAQTNLSFHSSTRTSTRAHTDAPTHRHTDTEGGAMAPVALRLPSAACPRVSSPPRTTRASTRHRGATLDVHERKKLRQTTNRGAVSGDIGGWVPSRRIAVVTRVSSSRGAADSGPPSSSFSNVDDLFDRGGSVADFYRMQQDMFSPAGSSPLALRDFDETFRGGAESRKPNANGMVRNKRKGARRILKPNFDTVSSHSSQIWFHI